MWHHNNQIKSDGYTLNDGKKSVKTDELLTMNGRPSKKKVDLERYNTNSFNSYRFGKISWFIDICAFEQSDMIAQQLKWDSKNDRRCYGSKV